ncbi:MAG: Fe-S protein radical family, partial [Candidatus Angelobacter sp.]|nr:Fe-S protein radical family [Candidatus Angelobacter sp.]
VPGSFARTLDAMYWANAIGLPVQINTTVSRRNIAELENVLSVIRNFRIVMWSLFFMVPTGRAEAADLPSAEEFESAFAKIYRLAQNVPFKVKTTEAQHYRRYLLQQRPRANREGYLQTACQEYCRSMRARVSCSFPTPVRCNPAVFFLSLRATYDRPMSATSTAIPNCFDSCATPTIYWASVETASSVTCAAGRELALMPSAEMPLPKTRAVHIFPGSEGQTARVQMHQ